MTATTKPRTRSVILSQDEAREAAALGTLAEIRREVRPPKGMLCDLSRAWFDASDLCLKVPVAHPVDGWEADSKADRVERVYCHVGEPGDVLLRRETWANGVTGVIKSPSGGYPRIYPWGGAA